MAMHPINMPLVAIAACRARLLHAHAGQGCWGRGELTVSAGADCLALRI